MICLKIWAKPLAKNAKSTIPGAIMPRIIQGCCRSV